MTRIYLDVTPPPNRFIGYQEKSETLEIQFSRGEVCQYFNVPSGVYNELMKSPAKEDYYHTRISERFPCSRIR